MANSNLWAEGVPLTSRRIQVGSVSNGRDIAHLESGGRGDASIPTSGDPISNISSFFMEREISKKVPTKQSRQFFKRSGIQNRGFRAKVRDVFESGTRADRAAGGPSQNAQQRRSQTNRDMVMIPMEEEKVEKKDEGNLLRNFLQQLYNMGRSTFNPSWDSKVPLTLRERIIDYLVKMVFWIGVIFALLRSFFSAKLDCLYFLVDEGIMSFVNFGFQIIAILTIICIIRMFGFDHDKIEKMVTKLDALNKFPKTREDIRAEKTEKAMLYVMIFMTIVVSILKAGLDTAIKNWSMEKMVEEKSLKLGFGMYFWKKDDIANYNETDFIANTLPSDARTLQTMATMQILMDFSHSMVLDMAINMIIVVAWCLLKNIRRRKKMIEQDELHQDGEESVDDDAILKSISVAWTHYRDLAEANKPINVEMDGQLKVMHIHNAMLCAYFLMGMLENQANSARFGYLLYKVVKVSIAYYIAKQSHGYNATFQQWIIDQAIRSENSKFLQKARYLLEKMKAEPLGLGTGEFIMGESFMVKFVGMVGSMFMLQVDKGDGT